MNQMNLGWAVGIFEGEGCIHIPCVRPRHRQPSPVLSVQMSDEDVLRRFTSLVGGNCSGPSLRVNRKQQKPIWRWSLGGRKTIPLLTLFLPHLGKRRRAKAVQALRAAHKLQHHAGFCRKDKTCCG